MASGSSDPSPYWHQEADGQKLMEPLLVSSPSGWKPIINTHCAHGLCVESHKPWIDVDMKKQMYRNNRPNGR